MLISHNSSSPNDKKSDPDTQYNDLCEKDSFIIDTPDNTNVESRSLSVVNYVINNIMSTALTG